MKIVIAVDDSQYAQEVIETLSDRKWPIDTAFKIIAVVEPAKALANRNENWKEFERLSFAKRKKEATEICTRAKEIIKNKVPNCVVHIDIRDGEPRDKIIEAATEWMADKILIGAHGHNLNERHLWGAISHAVATNAPCTVQIVRPSKTHRAQKPQLNSPAIVT